MSMLSSAESVTSCDIPFGWIADLAGEEKEGMGSMPFSSLIPVSLSSTPVRLNVDYERGDDNIRRQLRLPTFPCGQALYSLRALSLFAVSSLEPWFGGAERLAHRPMPTQCRLVFFLRLIRVTKAKVSMWKNSELKRLASSS